MRRTVGGRHRDENIRIVTGLGAAQITDSIGPDVVADVARVSRVGKGAVGAQLDRAPRWLRTDGRRLPTVAFRVQVIVQHIADDRLAGHNLCRVVDGIGFIVL